MTIITKNLYWIPSSNPLILSNNFKPEIVAYGLQEPLRIIFNDYQLIILDNGSTWNEVNVLPPFTADILKLGLDYDKETISEVLNYGWNFKEGSYMVNPNLLNDKFNNNLVQFEQSMGSLINPVNIIKRMGLFVSGVYSVYNSKYKDKYILVCDNKLYYCIQLGKLWRRGEIDINIVDFVDILEVSDKIYILTKNKLILL